MWGRVLLGVGWVIAESPSQGDRKAAVLPRLGIPHTHPRRVGPGVDTGSLFLSWVQVGWQEGGYQVK